MSICCLLFFGGDKPDSELAYCFFHLELIGEGLDVHGPAVLKVPPVELERLRLTKAFLPKIRPDPIFSAVPLMRDLPAGGKTGIHPCSTSGCCCCKAGRWDPICTPEQGFRCLLSTCISLKTNLIGASFNV